MNPINDIPKHHAMIVTKSTELCRRHGLGTCPHSDADCRHLHKGKAGAMAVKPAASSSPPRPPAGQTPTKTPYPKYISDRHRAAIGPPTGTVSAFNPNGVSRSQVKKVYALIRQEKENPDPWSNGSIAHAAGSTGGYSNPRILMMRASSSSSSTAPPVATSPERSESISDDGPIHWQHTPCASQLS